MLAKKPYNQEQVIATYKHLIRSMPRGNQYLLLYVLDLLSVFARKADKNLMTPQSEFHALTYSVEPRGPKYAQRFGCHLPTGTDLASKSRDVPTRAPIEPRSFRVPHCAPRPLHARHTCTDRI
jgi:hypothetical protein